MKIVGPPLHIRPHLITGFGHALMRMMQTYRITFNQEEVDSPPTFHIDQCFGPIDTIQEGLDLLKVCFEQFFCSNRELLDKILLIEPYEFIKTSPAK